MKTVRISCPLGHTCRTETEDEIRQCAWYVKLRGKDPQSDQEVDEWGCAIAWQPILQIEHSQFERQTGAAVESLRNEVVAASYNRPRMIATSVQTNKQLTKEVEIIDGIDSE